MRGTGTTIARRVLTNVGWLTLARGAQAVLALVGSIVLSRALGPDGLGTLGFGLALVSYFVYAVSLGFDTLGAREVAREPTRVDALAGSILSLRLGLGLVAGFLYAGLVYALPRPPSEAAALGFLGLAIPAQAFSLEWSFHGTERMREVAAYVAGVAVLQVTGYLLFVDSPEDIVYAAMIQGTALILGTSWLWIRHHAIFGPTRPQIAPTEQRRLLRLALPIATSSFMIAVYYNIDKVMIGLVIDDFEVGIYEAAYKLMTAAIMPCVILTQGFFPRLAAAYQSRDTSVSHTAALFAETVFLVGIPTGVVAAILGPSLIDLIFGPQFDDSAGPFMILTVNAVMVYVNAAYAQPLLAWDRQTAFMRAVITGAVVNVGLNVVLIPKYGAVGAAAATVAAELAILALVLRPHRVEAGSLHATSLRRPVIALFAGTSVGVVVYAAGFTNPFVTSALFALSYGAATLVMYTGPWLQPTSEID